LLQTVPVGGLWDGRTALFKEGDITGDRTHTAANPSPLNRLGRKERGARIALLEAFADRDALRPCDAIFERAWHQPSRRYRQIRRPMLRSALVKQLHRNGVNRYSLPGKRFANPLRR